MNKLFNFNLDFAGATAAIVCAVHCTSLPLLMSLGLIGGTGHNHLVDWGLMLIGVVIAGFSLYQCYLR